MAQVNGLLDWIQTPAGIGLLSAVAGGMAGAQRGTPWNNAGRAGIAGLAGYTGAKDQINKESENALTRQYKQMQMQELESKIAKHKAQQEWKSGLPQVMDQAKDKITPFEADNPFGEDLGNLANVQQGNPQAMQDYMMRPESPYADDLIKQQIMPDTVVVGKTLKNKNTGETLGYDETWKEEQAVARAQRIEELNMRLEDQRLNREQQMELRRELAGQQAALRRDLAAQQAAYQRESLNLRRDTLAQGNKPPAGYRYTQEGNLEAIKGGPADIKAGELGAKQVKQKELSIAQAGSVLNEVKDAQKLVGYSTVGVGGALRGLPMTPARDLDAKLTSIKANLGFDRLQQMRDASPTGGALGQVAVQELVALQSTVASLDQLQSPEQMRAALKKIETHYTNWQKTLKGDQQPKNANQLPTKPPAGVDAKVWQYMTPAERKLWQK